MTMAEKPFAENAERNAAPILEFQKIRAAGNPGDLAAAEEQEERLLGE